MPTLATTLYPSVITTQSGNSVGAEILKDNDGVSGDNFACGVSQKPLSDLGNKFVGEGRWQTLIGNGNRGKIYGKIWE